MLTPGSCPSQPAQTLGHNSTTILTTELTTAPSSAEQSVAGTSTNIRDPARCLPATSHVPPVDKNNIQGSFVNGLRVDSRGLVNKPCFDFARDGNCARGAACRYVHDVPFLKPPPRWRESVQLGSSACALPEALRSHRVCRLADNIAAEMLALVRSAIEVPDGIELPDGAKLSGVSVDRGSFV